MSLLFADFTHVESRKLFFSRFLLFTCSTCCWVLATASLDKYNNLNNTKYCYTCSSLQSISSLSSTIFWNHFSYSSYVAITYYYGGKTLSNKIVSKETNMLKVLMLVYSIWFSRDLGAPLILRSIDFFQISFPSVWMVSFKVCSIYT